MLKILSVGAAACVLELLTHLEMFGYVAMIVGITVMIYTLLTWKQW